MKNYLFSSRNKFKIYTILILPIALYGCNTMEGAGADIQKAGKALEQSAERNKENSPPCPCCSRHLCAPQK